MQISEAEVNVGIRRNDSRRFGRGVVIASAWVLGGCLFGGEGEESTEVPDPNRDDTTAVVDTTTRDTTNPPQIPVVLAQGVYRGDYGPSGDSLLLETEMILGEEGDYTFVIIQVNDARIVMTGKFAITPENQFATGEMRLAFSSNGNGLFDSTDWEAGAPDTAFLRNVTDTSFERYEALPGAAVPRSLWVKYTKTDYGRLQDGYFDAEATYEDSTGTYNYRTVVRLESGEPFLQRDFVNEWEYHQIESAGWRQQGSFLVTDDNVRRVAADSTSPLEDAAVFGGEIYYRVQDAGSDGFRIWYGPVDVFDEGAWVEYKRTEP